MPNTCTMWTMRAILMHASGERARQQLCGSVQNCPHPNKSTHTNASVPLHAEISTQNIGSSAQEHVPT